MGFRNPVHSSPVVLVEGKLCSGAMGGAAKTAAQSKIFRCTMSVHAVGWGMTWKKISLRSAPAVTGRDIVIAKDHQAN